MRILIADDHTLVRDGFRLLLKSHPDIEVVGEAADGKEAWQRTRELRPDVVLMDAVLPELHGAEATGRIKASCPDIKVLAVSGYQDELHIRRFLAAGASGYVLKTITSQGLIQAIRRVMEGGIYLDPSLAGHIVEGYLKPRLVLAGLAAAEHEVLSVRETEVLRLVAWGFTNQEIARQIHLSVKTVEGPKAQAMKKLGFTSRADVTLHALRQGWLKDE